MLLFGIFGLLLVGSIVAIILGKKRYAEVLEDCGWTIGICVTIAIIVCTYNIPWRRDIEYDKAEYEELKKELVQTSEKPESQAVLIGKVCEMNNKIDEHRIYKDSRWVGRLFSEDIANLDKIELK